MYNLNLNLIPEEEEQEELIPMSTNYDKILIIINPEYFRITAYVMFWMMILFCVTLTKIFVDPDLVENSPLVDMFGYNNICIFFDYPPARVATAMFYPFVEIPLLMYIVFNFLRLREAYFERPSLLKRSEFIMGVVFFPICFILAMYFRMVFVVEAFKDVVGHTLGFQGLIVSLALVAVQNHIYNKATNSIVFPRKPWIATTYLVTLLVVTVIKLILVWSIFLKMPIISPQTSFGAGLGRFLDIVWMILAAIVPLGIAVYQRKRTRNFKIILGD